MLIPIAMLGYGGLRLLGSFVTAWRRPLYAIETAAGKVRLQSKASADAYGYIAPRLKPGDGILDLYYGGGINVATLSMSPAFMTQFQILQPADALLREDARRTAARPPRFVIAANAADYGVVYGVCANCGCMFPQIPWRSTKYMCQPDKPMPLLDYIRANYHQVAVFGDKQILDRNEPQRNPVF